MSERLVISGGAAVAPAPPAKEGDPYLLTSLAAPPQFSAAVLRRMSRVGRMALAVVESALVEASVEPSPDLGLVVGTGLADIVETTGFLDGLGERGPAYASPQHFQRSVHGAMAGELAIIYGLTGYSLTISQGLHSGLAALFQSVIALEANRCRRCLCVAAESLSPAVLDAHKALGVSSTPGEGAVALVLESESSAANILAVIEDVDLAAIEQSRALDDRELGVHGARGLMEVALAIRAKRFSGLPNGVKLSQ